MRSPLRLQAVMFLLTLFVLSVSFYLQVVKGFEPCPLCFMQRIAAGVLLLLSASAMWFRKKEIIIAEFLFIVFGLFFALRQLWLLSLPVEATPACLPGLSVLIHYFSWQDTLHALFWGSGDCTKVDWTFLGLSMPMWSTLYFLLMGGLGITVYQMKTPSSQ